MHSPGIEHKRIFLIGFSNPKTAEICKNLIEKHISNSTIFKAVDGQDVLFKANNMIPHVAIIEVDLSKINGLDCTQQLLEIKTEHPIAVIIVSEIPDREHFVDEVVVGQVQFLKSLEDENLLSRCISKALNHVSFDCNSTYQMKFLAQKEILFLEGQEASSVFVVKKGELAVIKNHDKDPVVLGKVSLGEFVGEMAHFNSEPRSATVQALTDCELIEIPMGTLDMVLFSKPAWAKALVETLSRRLKKSNSFVHR